MTKNSRIQRKTRKWKIISITKAASKTFNLYLGKELFSFSKVEKSFNKHEIEKLYRQSFNLQKFHQRNTHNLIFVLHHIIFFQINILFINKQYGFCLGSVFYYAFLASFLVSLHFSLWYWLIIYKTSLLCFQSSDREDTVFPRGRRNIIVGGLEVSDV